MSDTRLRLSKSKIAAFEHCPRRLWLQIHRREAAHFDAATLERFRFGHDVGARAALLVPNGVMIDAKPDIAAALSRTAELVTRPDPRPLFEATFLYRNVLIRADILEPDGEGGWCAIEVKASTKVKRYQVADLATQVWVMRGCGLSISRAVIRHLAPPFSWSHADIASVRFSDTDVSTQVDRQCSTRSSIAEAASEAIRGSEIRRSMGRHCEAPLQCEFQRHCRSTSRFPLLSHRYDGQPCG